MNLAEDLRASLGGLQSRRDCDPKPGVARNELPRDRSRLSTNPNGVAPTRRNPVGVDRLVRALPRVGPLRRPTLGFGTESRWDSGGIPSGPHPGPLPRAGEGENVPWIPKGWAWGWREWRVMACAARADQIAAGDTRLPLLRERVGVRGSRRSSWRTTCPKLTCSAAMNLRRRRED